MEETYSKETKNTTNLGIGLNKLSDIINNQINKINEEKNKIIDSTDEKIKEIRELYKKELLSHQDINWKFECKYPEIFSKTRHMGADVVLCNKKQSHSKKIKELKNLLKKQTNEVDSSLFVKLKKEEDGLERVNNLEKELKELELEEHKKNVKIKRAQRTYSNWKSEKKKILDDYDNIITSFRETNDRFFDMINDIETFIKNGYIEYFYGSKTIDYIIKDYVEEYSKTNKNLI